MNPWELPTSLRIRGRSYDIRTDYRDILKILIALNDPSIFEPGSSEREKGSVRAEVMLTILYVDYDKIPENDIEEAIRQACEFIDCGILDDGKRRLHTMDWEQDAPIIIPAVNRVAGTEIRAVKYMHWWTFLGYYMEIGECLFSQVIGVRDKKARSKKLEKWEREFYEQNKNMVDLHRKYTADEQKERDQWNDFFSEWGG